jgi:hypothetical protein
MAKTKDALKILDRRIGRSRNMRRLIEAERVNADIAQMIYEARTQAGIKRPGAKFGGISPMSAPAFPMPTVLAGSRSSTSAGTGTG